MRFEMTRGKLMKERESRLFFLMCWVAYFTTYLGRLNYAACLAEISAVEGWSKSEAGLIATGFFITYGLGQLVNGIIGDKISPKIMVGLGLGFSGAVNLLFPMMSSAYAATVLWCINGFFQSMIWSPLIRILSEWMPEEKRLRTCVNMSSTVPAGTLAVYGLSAGLVYLGTWKTVFYVCGLFVLAVTVVWFAAIAALEKRVVSVEELVEAEEESVDVRRMPLGKLVLLSAIPLCCIALLMQGMLKDGVTTWIPTFLEERFQLTSAAAILSTTVVPIINLGGVYLASWLNNHIFKNEILAAASFFAVATGALLLLTVFGSSALLSLLLLALTTTFMMGVNTLLVSLVPSYYVSFGRCSTISGILNTAVYIGCAVSAYLNGAVVERFGWSAIMVCWVIYAVIGLAMCALSVRRWKKFRTEVTVE